MNRLGTPQTSPATHPHSSPLVFIVDDDAVMRGSLEGLVMTAGLEQLVFRD